MKAVTTRGQELSEGKPQQDGVTALERAASNMQLQGA